jgi:hypothetical protein
MMTFQTAALIYMLQHAGLKACRAFGLVIGILANMLLPWQPQSMRKRVRVYSLICNIRIGSVVQDWRPSDVIPPIAVVGELRCCSASASSVKYAE